MVYFIVGDFLTHVSSTCLATEILKQVRGSHVLIVLSSIISPDGADDKESEVDVELMWIWSLKNDIDSQEGGHA